MATHCLSIEMVAFRSAKVAFVVSFAKRIGTLNFRTTLSLAFLLGLAFVGTGRCQAEKRQAEKPWIIDTHTHFKGPEQVRVEGLVTPRVPRDTLGQVVVPEDYRNVADRLAIRSTIIVEATGQDHLEFNDWVLEQAKSDLVCGYLARGDLTSAEFATQHKRYLATGLLLGYRFRFEELRGYLDDEMALRNLKQLERDGMVVDLLIEFQHSADVQRLAKRFPSLKIVINHCLRARMKDGEIGNAWREAIIACAKFPNVNCKLSSILNFSDAEPFGPPAPATIEHYLPILQACFDAFGEDRVIFATNWGVCTHFGSVDDVVRIATKFLEKQGGRTLTKGMRDNAIRIYGISPQQLR
jgi:L-fuconolactonase